VPAENGFHHLRLKLRNKVIHADGTHDLDVLADGGVTITPVTTNWTCHETLKLWGLPK